MEAQSLKSLGIALLVTVLVGIAYAANPIATVPGVVTDEDGKPLEGVKVQLCGMETLQDGVWKRVSRLGDMPWWTTDKQGRFAIKFGEKNIRYDLWFEKRGFAPTFLYGISAKSGELKVILRKGVIVTGTVTRLVDGREKPVEGVEVVLTGPRPSTDLMYRQESATDHKGSYSFRASPAPAGKKWAVVFLYESTELEVGDKDPVSGPDFVVTLTVKEKKGATTGQWKQKASTIPVGTPRAEVEKLLPPVSIVLDIRSGPGAGPVAYWVDDTTRVKLWYDERNRLGKPVVVEARERPKANN